jgi:hypothetical protein
VNERYGTLETAFKERGAEGYWQQQLEWELAKGNGQPFSTNEDHFMRLAAIYARLNDPDNAFSFLDRAFEDTPTGFANSIFNDPSFDGLRSKPGWAELMNRLRRRR